MKPRRIFLKKAPEALAPFRKFHAALNPEIVPDPTKEEVSAAEKHVVQKDAPIIAAAKGASADFLVTLDKKHLLGKSRLSKYAEIEIVTPEEALKAVRKAT